MISIVMVIEVEQIEQVADGRHVARHVGVVVLTRIGQRGIEHPVPFNKLYKRGMLAISVADMAARREGRNRDHWYARARSEEINRLDEALVVEAPSLVHGDEDRGLGP
jgi:hypothetical protein